MACFKDGVALLRALAEPTRFRLINLINLGEFTLKDLTKLLGQSQPRVSRHVKLLADAGLIERYHEGSWVFVRASNDPDVRSFLAKALQLVDQNDPQIRRDMERAQTIRKERADTAQRYFNQSAADWDRIRALHVPERDVETAILKAIGPGPFDLVLDVGTGTGRIAELLSDCARRVVGIDSNREMLKCARVRLDQPRLSHCSVRLGDVYNLPFQDKSVDVVVIHQVLHFLDNPEAALKEAARLLKPDGRLLLVDFAPHDLEFLRDHHAHRRLGFVSSEVKGWISEAGLHQIQYSELRSDTMPEGALTVAIWLASKTDQITEALPQQRKVA